MAEEEREESKMTGEGVFNIQLVQGFWWNGTHITMAGLRIASAHCEAQTPIEVMLPDGKLTHIARAIEVEGGRLRLILIPEVKA